MDFITFAPILIAIAFRITREVTEYYHVKKNMKKGNYYLGHSEKCNSCGATDRYLNCTYCGTEKK